MLAFLGLGSNVGDRHANLQAAVNFLDLRAGDAVRISPVYETDPMYIEDQEPFLNAVIAIDTRLSPSDLLHTVKLIEIEIGRIPRDKFGPREIDIDLLAFEDGSGSDSDDLTVPHPRIAERRFVLQPLADIAPELDIGGISVADALAAILDQADSVRLSQAQLTVHSD